MSQLEFRVLGPVELRRDGRPVRVTGKKLTALAGLLLSANEIVPVDTIGEWMWGAQPPAHPRAALHNALSRLRQLLEPDVIETTAGGYRLVAEASQLDLLRFRQLAAAAAGSLRSGSAPQAADLLSDALSLHREPLLANIDSPALARDMIGRLTEQYLSAHEAYARISLQLGRYSVVAETLSALVRAHPFREALAESLMIALAAGGRRAEALATYDRIRGTLRDELGIDPGIRLRDLHLQILKESLRPAGPRTADSALGLINGAVAHIPETASSFR